MNEVYAYTMIDMMKGVAEYGTASSGLKRLGINAEIAAKTGTTNNNSDGWFMGISSQTGNRCMGRMGRPCNALL